jgi:hypothetical protein
MRVTDIWRSLVAQRIAWANGWLVLFHEPTVRQEPNEHNLMADFEAEVPGYCHNRQIAERLDALTLAGGVEHRRLTFSPATSYSSECRWLEPARFP